MGILRLGYVEVRVDNLELAVRHYTQVIGLKETGRQDGKVYLKAWDEQEHHQVVLVEDPVPGLNHLAFRVEDPEDLVTLEDRLERNEYRVQRISAGEHYAMGEAIRFTAPSEQRIELYYEMQIVGNGLPLTGPDPYPEDLVGIHPPRLDHALLTTPDTNASLHFWRDVLGFRLTEQVVAPDGMPIAVWLERSHTPHDLALVPGKPGGFHHFAFWLDSWEEVGRAADTLARNGTPLDLGPTRHGISRGHTVYFKDPCGLRNEVFTGGYWADPRMTPITWPANDLWVAVNYWDRSEHGSFLASYS